MHVTRTRPVGRGRRRTTRTAGRAAGALAAAAAIGFAAASPAGAGGGYWVSPARDRYEAGQTVTMIGYGEGVDATLRARGPFYAWLRVDPAAAEADGLLDPQPWAAVHPTDLRVGQVIVEDLDEPAEPGPFGGNQRLSVTFDLPPNLPDAHYQVRFCNDPCTDALAEFIAEPVNVGVDPEYPVVRAWPLTDPAIRWLEDDALLSLGDGRQVTAAEVRAGTVTAPALPPAPAPPAPPPATDVDSAERAAAPDPPDPGESGDEPDATDAAADVRTGDRGDGGAAAWWVAAEAAALVVGGVAAMTWAGRRRRRSGRSRGSTRLVVRTGGSSVGTDGPAGAAPAEGPDHSAYRAPAPADDDVPIRL